IGPHLFRAFIGDQLRRVRNYPIKNEGAELQLDAFNIPMKGNALNNINGTSELVNLAAPTHPVDEIERAHVIIAAARELPEEQQMVYPGTPEWDVLVEFCFDGDEEKVWTEATPDLLYKVLTE